MGRLFPIVSLNNKIFQQNYRFHSPCCKISGIGREVDALVILNTLMMFLNRYKEEFAGYAF